MDEFEVRAKSSEVEADSESDDRSLLRKLFDSLPHVFK